MTTSKSPKISKLSFSVIVPNLNGHLYLPTCINSLLLAFKNANLKKFQIILVDNASTDNSINTFSKLIKTYDSSIIINKQNNGFAASVNQGIAKAKHSYLIVCNNDIKIDKNWFKHIKQAIKNHPDISTYFGLVLNQNGTKIESQGLNFDWSGKAKNINNGLPYSPKIKNCKLKIVNSTIWGAPASLVIYKKNVLQKIGGFDDDFFAYEEDVDLCLRLNKSGHKTLFIPQAISYHIGGATSNKMGNLRAIMDTRNWFYIIAKNYPIKKIIKHLPQIITQRLANLKYLITSTIKIYQFKSIWALPVILTKVYGQVLLNLPKMIKKRSSIYINFLDKF